MPTGWYVNGVPLEDLVEMDSSRSIDDYHASVGSSVIDFLNTSDGGTLTSRIRDVSYGGSRYTGADVTYRVLMGEPDSPGGTIEVPENLGDRATAAGSSPTVPFVTDSNNNWDEYAGQSYLLYNGSSYYGVENRTTSTPPLSWLGQFDSGGSPISGRGGSTSYWSSSPTDSKISYSISWNDTSKNFVVNFTLASNATTPKRYSGTLVVGVRAQNAYGTSSGYAYHTIYVEFNVGYGQAPYLNGASRDDDYNGTVNVVRGNSAQTSDSHSFSGRFVQGGAPILGYDNEGTGQVTGNNVSVSYGGVSGSGSTSMTHTLLSSAPKDTFTESSYQRASCYNKYGHSPTATWYMHTTFVVYAIPPEATANNVNKSWKYNVYNDSTGTKTYSASFTLTDYFAQRGGTGSMSFSFRSSGGNTSAFIESRSISGNMLTITITIDTNTQFGLNKIQYYCDVYASDSEGLDTSEWVSFGMWWEVDIELGSN